MKKFVVAISIFLVLVVLLSNVLSMMFVNILWRSGGQTPLRPYLVNASVFLSRLSFTVNKARYNHLLLCKSLIYAANDELALRYLEDYYQAYGYRENEYIYYSVHLDLLFEYDKPAFYEHYLGADRNLKINLSHMISISDKADDHDYRMAIEILEPLYHSREDDDRNWSILGSLVRLYQHLGDKEASFTYEIKLNRHAVLHLFDDKYNELLEIAESLRLDTAPYTIIYTDGELEWSTEPEDVNTEILVPILRLFSKISVHPTGVFFTLRDLVEFEGGLFYGPLEESDEIEFEHLEDQWYYYLLLKDSN